MSRNSLLLRQQLALRFQTAPGDYAHHSWWPAAFLNAFGPACRPDAGASAQLSAWMLEQHGLLGSIDLEFEAPCKRFWLLPAAVIRRTALDLGAALHRHLIGLCVTRSSWQWLSARLERETIDFALSDAAAQWAPPRLSGGTATDSIPDAGGCADIGAGLLLQAASGTGEALEKRARLIFPQALQTTAALTSMPESGRELMAGAITRSLQITPSWRWLYS